MVIRYNFPRCYSAGGHNTETKKGILPIVKKKKKKKKPKIGQGVTSAYSDQDLLC